MTDSKTVLPDMDEIMRAQIPTIKRWPQQCKNAVTKALTATLRQCYSAATEEAQIRAWKLKFMFAKCVCRMQPQIRGGRKKKLKRNESLRTALLARVTRWTDGEYSELWAEACAAYGSAKGRPPPESSLEANIKRAKLSAQDARYGKAVAALLSLGTAEITRETVREMKAKHPEAPPPLVPPPFNEQLPRYEEDLVREKIESFPAGSAAGASGLRPQFLQDMLACPNKQVGKDALKTLRLLANHLAAGKAENWHPTSQEHLLWH